MSETVIPEPTADPPYDDAAKSKECIDCLINYFPLARCNSVDEYKKLVGSDLGKRKPGIVFKAKHTESDQEVAMKRLVIDRNWKNGIPLTFMREVLASKNLKHPNVARLLDIVVGQKLENVFLVLEYCEEDLARILEQTEFPLAQDEIKCLMGQLMLGLEYIHGMGFIHRDINPSNLLLSSSGVLKICDFGSSREMSQGGSMTPGLGTEGYKAPEVIFELKNYTTAVDMWSAGCIFGEMLRNAPLFPCENQMNLLSKIIDLLGTPNEEIMPGFSETIIAKSYELKSQKYNMISTVFKGLPEGAIMMLKHFLTYNPAIRFTAEQALESEYFNEDPPPVDIADLFVGIAAKKNI